MMNQRRWLAIGLKLIGVLLIGWSLPHWLADIAGLMRTYRGSGNTIGAWGAQVPLWEHVLWLSLGPALTLGIGLYLLFGGRWLLNQCLPYGERSCFECGYDLSGNDEAARCPECGAALAAASDERGEPGS